MQFYSFLIFLKILPQYQDVVWSSDSEEDDSEEVKSEVSFSTFDEQIRKSLAKVGGSAFLKIGNTAPTDASLEKFKKLVYF